MTNKVYLFLDNMKEDTTLAELVVISFSKGYTTFKEQGNQTRVYLSISLVRWGKTVQTTSRTSAAPTSFQRLWFRSRSMFTLTTKGCRTCKHCRLQCHLERHSTLTTTKACWEEEGYCLLINNWWLRRRLLDWFRLTLRMMDRLFGWISQGLCWSCPILMFWLELKVRFVWIVRNL